MELLCVRHCDASTKTAIRRGLPGVSTVRYGNERFVFKCGIGDAEALRSTSSRSFSVVKSSQCCG